MSTTLSRISHYSDYSGRTDNSTVLIAMYTAFKMTSFEEERFEMWKGDGAVGDCISTMETAYKLK